MNNKPKKPIHLRSVVHRDENGNITAIGVVETEQPRFHTPAYDELVRGNNFPDWLRKKVE